MGRGLSAILAVSQTGAEERDDLRELSVELISANPRQPRRNFDDTTLGALAESLRTRGVLQPILVRPIPGGRYELIAGERRWRAAQARRPRARYRRSSDRATTPSRLSSP